MNTVRPMHGGQFVYEDDTHLPKLESSRTNILEYDQLIIKANDIVFLSDHQLHLNPKDSDDRYLELEELVDPTKTVKSKDQIRIDELELKVAKLEEAIKLLIGVNTWESL